MHIALRRVLNLQSARYIAALPSHNKVLIHADNALLSFSMDLLARVSQGNSPPAALEASMEKISGSDNVTISRAGVVKDRTVGTSLLFLVLSSSFFFFLGK